MRVYRANTLNKIVNKHFYFVRSMWTLFRLLELVNLRALVIRLRISMDHIRSSVTSNHPDTIEMAIVMIIVLFS